MLRLSTKLRTNLAGTTGFATTFEKGIIDVYSGTQPATADLAPTGVKLGRFTLASGAFTQGNVLNGLTFGTAADGAVAKSGTWSFSAGVAVGTAGWFRLSTNAAADNVTDDSTAKAVARLDGSVGTSGADLNLSNLSITLSSPVTVDTFTWTQPAT